MHTRAQMSKVEESKKRKIGEKEKEIEKLFKDALTIIKKRVFVI